MFILQSEHESVRSYVLVFIVMEESGKNPSGIENTDRGN